MIDSLLAEECSLLVAPSSTPRALPRHVQREAARAGGAAGAMMSWKIISIHLEGSRYVRLC